MASGGFYSHFKVWVVHCKWLQTPLMASAGFYSHFKGWAAHCKWLQTPLMASAGFCSHFTHPSISSEAAESTQ
jgi:hypothetical protein